MTRLWKAAQKRQNHLLQLSLFCAEPAELNVPDENDEPILFVATRTGGFLRRHNAAIECHGGQIEQRLRR